MRLIFLLVLIRVNPYSQICHLCTFTAESTICRPAVRSLATVVIGRELGHNVADWFGVANQSEEERQSGINRWQLRSQRTLGANRLFGTFKALAPPRSDTLDSVFEPSGAVTASPGLGGRRTAQPCDGSPGPGRRTAQPCDGSPGPGRRTAQPYDPLARAHR